jgi:hypothetical protein
MTTQDGPKAPPHLDGRHQHTFEAIFRHPTGHNLEWHDVRSLLGALADVEEKHNGSLQVSRNGTQAILHPPKHKDVTSVDDVLAIRRFLEMSAEPENAPNGAQSIDLLVVIDHREAKIYRAETHGTLPEKLVPYDPHGFGRHLHSENPETDGKRQPERKSYYEAVAKTLRGADRILIFGNGTGESSAMDRLLADLKHNHRDVAGHVVGSIVIDEHHESEGELLAKARELFLKHSVSGSVTA